MTKRLYGVLPIVHTPFLDDDSIDAASLKREIDFAFACGADGLGTGMVSEILRLTSDERIGLTHLIAELAAGRGAVFAAVDQRTKLVGNLAIQASRFHGLQRHVRSPRCDPFRIGCCLRGLFAPLRPGPKSANWPYQLTND